MDVPHRSPSHGWIEVITGSMFSGKSEELIRRLRRAQIARQRVQIFKPAFDNRFAESDIVSHSEMRIQGVNVGDSAELLRLIHDDTEVVGIDEAQFFDKDLPAACTQLAGSGKRVVVAGLDTDYLDLLLLHRPDALVEPEEVAAAFDELESSGKVLSFGVSNHTAGQLELLRKSVRQPIVVNQVELSLVHTPLIDAGIATNQSHFSFGADGTLDYCRLHGITLQAWAPLARGRALGGDGDERSRELSRVVARIAEQNGVPKEAIPIAFLLRHPARIQVVIGTTQPARIAAGVRACDVELSREEWYELYVAGRGASLP